MPLSLSGQGRKRAVKTAEKSVRAPRSTAAAEDSKSLTLELARLKTYTDHGTGIKFEAGRGYRMSLAKGKALLSRVDDMDAPIFIVYDPDRKKKLALRQKRMHARNAGITDDREFDTADRRLREKEGIEDVSAEQDEDYSEDEDQDDDIDTGVMRLNGVGVVEV